MRFMRRNSTNKPIDVEGMKGKEEESEQKKIKFLLNPISLVNYLTLRARRSSKKIKRTTITPSGLTKNTYN